MKHVGIFSFLLLLLFSCTSRDKSKIEEIYSIKLDDVQETTLTYSDIIDIQEWIVLDSLNECTIGDVAKIEEFNKEYYVLDKAIQKCVLVFDEHGKYLRRIGRIGQGPGEYAQIYDFTINRRTGCVAILSGLSKVYVYDLKGEFRVTKQVSVMIAGILCHLIIIHILRVRMPICYMLLMMILISKANGYRFLLNECLLFLCYLLPCR